MNTVITFDNISASIVDKNNDCNSLHYEDLHQKKCDVKSNINGSLSKEEYGNVYDINIFNQDLDIIYQCKNVKLVEWNQHADKKIERITIEVLADSKILTID